MTKNNGNIPPDERPSFIDPAVLSYMASLSAKRELSAQKNLRDATRHVPLSIMQIGVDQGQVLGVLALLCNTKRAIEVGVFTGYSALSVAKHIPVNGTLVACDISQESTAVGEPYWLEAGVRERIDLRIGPALATLDSLITDGQAGTFDFAFIDADKVSIHRYYEQCLELLRPGGLITIDNVFMFGRAVQPLADDADGQTVNALVASAFEDDRVEPALLAVGDGLLLARKY